MIFTFAEYEQWMSLRSKAEKGISDESLIAEWQDRHDDLNPPLSDAPIDNINWGMKHAYMLCINELKTRKFVFQQNKPVPHDPNWVYPEQSFEETP